MNKDILKGQWKQLQGKVKQQWGKLTDNDVTRIDGSYDTLEGLLQEQYGYNKDQAAKEIEKFVSTHKSKDAAF